MAVILSTSELGNLSFLQQSRNFPHMSYLQALSTRQKISVMGEFISEEQVTIDKLLSYYVVIVGVILSSIFTVGIVDRKMHCATWWTLPALEAIASAGIIAAVVMKVYSQFRVLVDREPLIQELNQFLDSGSIERHLLMRFDARLFSSLQNMQMEIKLRGEMSVGWWCATRAGLFLALIPFSSLIFIACNRLAC